MPKLHPIDKRMLDLVNVLKDRGDIRFTQEFCDAIGILKQNYRNVKEGTQYFTPVHIAAACKNFNINANWVFGLSDQMGRVTAEIKFMRDATSSNKKVNKPKRKAVK
jgi:hypothetical protein